MQDKKGERLFGQGDQLVAEENREDLESGPPPQSVEDFLDKARMHFDL